MKSSGCRDGDILDSSVVRFCEPWGLGGIVSWFYYRVIEVQTALRRFCIDG